MTLILYHAAMCVLKKPQNRPYYWTCDTSQYRKPLLTVNSVGPKSAIFSTFGYIDIRNNLFGGGAYYMLWPAWV